MIELFPRPVKDILINKIQVHFRDELEIKLGNFDTEFLLDFFTEQVGPHYYNQAIRDVQVHLAGFIENVNERVDELEKPLPRS